jgi:hypothetical protein
MALPVWCVNGRVFDGIACMDHLTIAGIDTNMGYRIAGIVCTCEKDNIPGSRF